MQNFQLTEIVKNLIIINVLFFIGTLILLGNERGMLALDYPTMPGFRPYQLVTCFFMHANVAHIFMNMLGLAVFGPAVEMVWGARRFLFYYLLCGLGASAFDILVVYIQVHYFDGSEAHSSWGASGAVFGVMLAYGMLFPNNRMQLLFPPIELPAWGAVVLFGGTELVMGAGSFQTGVAHWAHLGGMITGFLVIQFWRAFGIRF